MVRLGFAPALGLGINGAGIAVIVSGAGVAWLGALLLGAIGLSFAAERIAPWSPGWNRSHGDGFRDTLHALVNETSSLTTIAMAPVLVTALGTGGFWPSRLPFALQVIASLVVLDLGIGLAHYASHRIDWLWRLHAVHHSVKRMYGFNGLMKHPLHQAVETFAGTAPLLLMGLPADVGLALAFCTTIQLLLQHSNVDYRVGWLRRILAVAEVHRFHHRPSSGEGDVNFGLFTTFVDHALGTYHWELEAPREDQDIGIGAEPDYPTGYIAQLMQPFRTQRDQPATAS